MYRFKLCDLESCDRDEWLIDHDEVYPKGMFDEFSLVYDPEAPLGCKIVCKECGVGAWVSVSWFPCKKRFVVTKVICRFGCAKHRWELVIKPEEPVGVTKH